MAGFKIPVILFSQEEEPEGFSFGKAPAFSFGKCGAPCGHTTKGAPRAIWNSVNRKGGTFEAGSGRDSPDATMMDARSGIARHDGSLD